MDFKIFVIFLLLSYVSCDTSVEYYEETDDKDFVAEHTGRDVSQLSPIRQAKLGKLVCESVVKKTKSECFAGQAVIDDRIILAQETVTDLLSETSIKEAEILVLGSAYDSAVEKHQILKDAEPQSNWFKFRKENWKITESWCLKHVVDVIEGTDFSEHIKKQQNQIRTFREALYNATTTSNTGKCANLQNKLNELESENQNLKAKTLKDAAKIQELEQQLANILTLNKNQENLISNLTNKLQSYDYVNTSLSTSSEFENSTSDDKNEAQFRHYLINGRPYNSSVIYTSTSIKTLEFAQTSINFNVLTGIIKGSRNLTSVKLINSHFKDPPPPSAAVGFLAPNRVHFIVENNGVKSWNELFNTNTLADLFPNILKDWCKISRISVSKSGVYNFKWDEKRRSLVSGFKSLQNVFPAKPCDCVIENLSLIDSELPPSVVPPNLKQLTIVNSTFDGNLLPGIFSKCDELTQLKIISRLSPARARAHNTNATLNLEDLPQSVTTLFLRRMNITQLPSNFENPLSNVKKIVLSECYFDEAGVASVAEMFPALEEVFINDFRNTTEYSMTTTLLPELMKIESLVYIYISGFNGSPITFTVANWDEVMERTNKSSSFLLYQGHNAGWSADEAEYHHFVPYARFDMKQLMTIEAYKDLFDEL